ncbi:MAG: cytochrome c3 family protein [Gammaproteobacteria bacterium]|jgi:c(7)-type cytochrome triheme protein
MSRNNDDKINWRFAVLGLLAGLAMLAITPAKAEYADVIINNYADAAGMRPVVFPHWFHRIRFRCKVCHADLGFKFKAGGNKITMAKIIDGKFCGACHNGQIAWSVANCNMCHSGIPGTPTHIHGSTVQRLVAPPYVPLKARVQQPPQTKK